MQVGVRQSESFLRQYGTVDFTREETTSIPTMVPPLITLEEHFFSATVFDNLDSKYAEQFKHIPGLSDKLRDLGDIRLRYMDEGKVSLQIISHAPGSITVSQCREANDQLAAAVTENKSRFAGFAVLPVAQPEECAIELTRCVKELGFVGALIDNNSGGKYYDGEDYYALFEAAEKLDVPIYLHPTWPSDEMNQQLYTGNFTDGAARSLGASGFGWHSDVALHVLRLFAAGLFDRFPKLKIIIGHMGEMLPFMLERIMVLSKRWGNIKRPFKEVWDDNIWITTSGVWSLNPLATILRNTKIDHILYSVDYPFEKNENGLAWIEELEKSGMVTKEQLDAIAYKNAEQLLRVKAPQS